MGFAREPPDKLYRDWAPYRKGTPDGLISPAEFQIGFKAKVDRGNYIRTPGYMESHSAIAALGALAQATRLDTYKLLVRHEPDGLPAGEVARQLKVPQNTMSAHLAILSRSGLVRSERHSRSIIYHADLDALRALMLFLIKDCCAGNADLCAPLLAELTPCC